MNAMEKKVLKYDNDDDDNDDDNDDDADRKTIMTVLVVSCV